MFAVFGEQGRTMRVCWVLSSLFVNKGYCFATNRTLADMTVMAENKVQSTLKDLEEGSAIVRGSVTDANGQKQRVIYPAIGILIRPTSRHGGTPKLGVGGDPQQPGVHTYNRRARGPKTAREAAFLAAQIREDRENRDRGKDQTRPKRTTPMARAKRGGATAKGSDPQRGNAIRANGRRRACAVGCARRPQLDQ
jgi:hypothetical protein